MYIKCSELINLYNDLLSKKEEFSSLISLPNKDNIKSIRDIINYIKEAKKIIEKISDKYIDNRIEFKEFYNINFINFYTKNNLEIPDFREVKIPEKPNDGFKYKLLFIDPRLAGKEKELLEEIKNNIKYNDSNIPVGKESMLPRIDWSVKPESEPQRIIDNKPYAIWVKDIQNSTEDDSMLRSYPSSKAISYNDIYNNEGNYINTKYINPITNNLYTRDDFMSIGEYMIMFVKKYKEGIVLDKNGWFKSFSLNADKTSLTGEHDTSFGGGFGDGYLRVSHSNNKFDYSDIRFRIAISIK